MGTIKLGALCWNQYSDWSGLREAGVRADRLGYDTLWTWDHLYPIVGDSNGPMFEAWLTLAAWAEATTNARLGLMVGANTFRNPALVAKMATTLDHISGGRAIVGIGGAWFEEEHEAFGIEFGSGFPERLRWLAEALPVIRGMLDGTEPTATGPRYAARAVRNLPVPVQAHVPIVVGGGGEQVTLKLVAKYADMNNVGGTIDDVRRKEEVLLRHCETVGRDPSTIERSTGLGVVIIRDDRDEAERINRATFEHNGNADVWRYQKIGTPEDVAELIAPFVELGYRHLIAGIPAPYDEESMTRLVTEVKPLLERI
ncbi:MAG TPA: LLM class flavin-dependent oxidoreductase [Candidatus Limnocylindrales bacterium]|nr:LLM class flavin-dependent oxidoreductase [Candidatus Limnocylindrales bacterium]